MSKHHYQATATRGDRWWFVEIHGLPPDHFAYTQGRHLVDAEFMARDAIAALLDIDIDDVTVELAVGSDTGEGTHRSAGDQAASGEDREERDQSDG